MSINHQAIPDEMLLKVKGLISKRLHHLADVESEKLVRLYPEESASYAIRGDYFASIDDYNYASKYYEKAIELSKKFNSSYYGAAATAWMMIGNQQKALGYCKIMRQYEEGVYQANLTEANLWGLSNDINKQREVFSKIPVTSQTEITLQKMEAKILIGEKSYGIAVDHLKKMLDGYSGSDTDWVDAKFLLAKCYDKMHEYDLAWQAATDARERIPSAAAGKFGIDAFEKRCDEIINFCNKDTYEILPKSELKSQLPVFIVGMARSGTTLLEQILGMHSRITNAGELSITTRMMTSLATKIDSYRKFPECLIDLRVEDLDVLHKEYLESNYWFSREFDRVTNKNLALWEQVGLISLVLPRSSFIFLNRHPLDNGLSCYLTPLSASGSHAYTHKMEHFGRFYLCRRKMLDHWKNEILEDPPLELEYENLTVNQEFETKRILDFLDVEWEDSCLQFHKSKRVATTISFDQVTQKMYTSSVARWKNYERHLQPLADVVSNYL